MKNQNTNTSISQSNIEDFRSFLKSDLETQIRQKSLEFIQEIMEEEIEALCGKRFSRKGEENLAYRAGSENVFISILGKKHKTKKPRVRKSGEEIILESYASLKSEADLGEIVFKLMVSGLSTRRFKECLKEVSDQLGVSKSKISREFVNASRAYFNKLNTRKFPGKEFFSIFIDGIHVADEVIVVVLGVDKEGHKHFLSVVQGSSEHSEVVLSALRKLQDREISLTERVLVVSDGSKGIEKGIKQYFGENYDHQRCILHKMKNIKACLPKEYHEEFQVQYKAIFNLNEYAKAKESLNNMIHWLGDISESAKLSLLEGRDNLLTCHRIQLPVEIRKTFLSTNPIDSAFSHPRFQMNRVKRWRKNRDMTTRWTAALLYAQELHFRRVKGYKAIEKFLNIYLDKEKVIDENFNKTSISLSA